MILCGLSAGSLCWYSQGVTSFHGEVRRVRGLGLLPWSNCVHYGTEQGPREAYHQLLQRGMCPGYAAEDGTRAALPRLAAGRRRRLAAGRAGLVRRRRRRQVIETALPTRYLGRGADEPATAADLQRRRLSANAERR